MVQGTQNQRSAPPMGVKTTPPGQRVYHVLPFYSNFSNVFIPYLL